jgi:uncharacterized membrane protein (DUF2068 family)|tara:strand:- start:16 stop:441 length:426 start_codon:yes stop_codon:yes gene_type:complete
MKKRTKSTKNKKIPVGIKILSILGFIGASILLLMAILMFLGSAGSITNTIPVLALLGPTILAVGGIILLGFSILEFFIARGLWKGQNWARIVMIVFVVLGILGGITAIIQGQIASNIISFAINLLIGWYLIFNEKVKKAFA